MKRSVFCLFFIGMLLWSACHQPSTGTKARIETSMGNMDIVLYDETPKHRDNFIKLAKEKYFDDLLFHRIIPNFVIQGGDPLSKGAGADVFLGSGGPNYLIDAEIGAPHFKGTLAAARDGNPEKKSSGSQFYVVLGAPVTDQELDQWESNKGIKYNAAQREKYKKLGGLPSLDKEYTVFGEVIMGLEVAEKIVNTPRSPADRPLQDVKMKIRLL